MLTNEGRPCSCEADANGTVTQLILSWLSGDVAYGTDLVSVDVESDTAVLWHCGLAPLGMADPAVKPRAALHSNRGVPLVMEFPLKPGRVTLARLSRASGRLQMVVGGGEMISAKPSFSGTSGVLRFDRDVRQVLDTLLSLGLEHHLSITYGDHRQSMRRLAEWLELPIVELS
jgi:L-fucose isomerase-like protein